MMKKGELTHIDLVGPMNVMSLNGNSYFLTLVDDATCYVTAKPLKTKKDATQAIRDYGTYLEAQNIHIHALFRCNRGKEFLNVESEQWCKEKGIELQLTAPFLPSQNGVAERMNQTLVELARTMMIARDIPKFLWESTVEHAAYVRN